MTGDKSLPQIRSFVEQGGTLLTLGKSATFATQLGARVRYAITDSTGRALPRSRFYIPGSLLTAKLDTTNAIAWGMRPAVDVFFETSPAFWLMPDAASRGIKSVAWFDSEAPLRSGWAWGQRALKGLSAIVVAPLGKGTMVLYGPEVYFRSQPHGTFPLLFNGIYYSQEQQH